MSSSPVGEDWQRNVSTMKCDKPEHFFFVASIDYPGEQDIHCLPNKLFGGIFPSWEIPGLDYPSVTNLYCVNAMECRDYSKLGPDLDPLGLMDNFDWVNWVVGDTFQYFCSMDGKGGGQGMASVIIVSSHVGFQFIRSSLLQRTLIKKTRSSILEATTLWWTMISKAEFSRKTLSLWFSPRLGHRTTKLSHSPSLRHKPG